MKEPFRSYKQRNVKFREAVYLDNWVIKVYIISAKASFDAEAVLEHVKCSLASLLEKAQDHHHSAFLIVHQGTDGVWSLLNWWTGKEMLRTQTYFTSFEQQAALKLNPEIGSMACIWELAVINHERNAWVKHILMKASHPDFESYYQDVIEGSI